MEANKQYVKTIKKSELDVFLKCYLCSGFLRNAHTINECMCSFCKACIVKYFVTDPKREKCPKCQNTVSLGGKPLKTVVSD
jgi:E3 ubiquitin-protein ligase DRIP